jgi:hypothetical protein
VSSDSFFSNTLATKEVALSNWTLSAIP